MHHFKFITAAAKFVADAMQRRSRVPFEVRRNNAQTLAFYSLALLCGTLSVAALLQTANAQDESPLPTSSQVITAVMGPFTADLTRKVDTVTTTEEDMFSADLAAADQSISVVQDILVTNLSATDKVCAFFQAWGTACTAPTVTCTGASTDGSVVLPNTQRTFRPNGALRPCIVSSNAGGSLFSAERNVSRGQ